MPERIYTRTGDDGSTGLIGGRRVGKDSPRVEACGAVDELNAHVGRALACHGSPALAAMLRAAQDALFRIGAELATPPDAAGIPGTRTASVTAGHVAALERAIDAVAAGLPALRTFILPGGSPLAADLHVARAVCRRAERRCAALHARELVGEHVLPYLNRLSDLLFVLARQMNRDAGVEDTPWFA
ncbi:MAG TPA: cob(I)yrinic acid a,c-diamide adenosyltransferase [Chthonomonadales bacterium]|nr:cob(I)yrinic acid a,c-diamide adenosyltransferase [Chthonomonadales bacterium]